MYLMYFTYFIHLMYCILLIHFITHNNRRCRWRRQQHKGAGAKAPAPLCCWCCFVCDEVNEEDAVHQVDKVDEVHQVHQVDPAHQVKKSRWSTSSTSTRSSTSQHKLNQQQKQTVGLSAPLESISAKNYAICTGQKFHSSHGDYFHEQNSFKKQATIVLICLKLVLKCQNWSYICF